MVNFLLSLVGCRLRTSRKWQMVSGLSGDCAPPPKRDAWAEGRCIMTNRAARIVLLILISGTLQLLALDIPAPQFPFRDIDFLGSWKIRGTLAGMYLEGMWSVNPDGTGSMVYIATVRGEEAKEVERTDGQSAFNWKVDRDGYLIIHFKPESTLPEDILRRPRFFVPMKVKPGDNKEQKEKKGVKWDKEDKGAPELVFRQLPESPDGHDVQLGEELIIRQTGNPYCVLP